MALRFGQFPKSLLNQREILPRLYLGASDFEHSGVCSKSDAPFRRAAADFYRIQQGRAVATAVNRTAAEEWTNRVVELLTEHVDADAAREFIESSRGITAFSQKVDAQAAALDKIIERIGVE
jgi:hypothetical protein